jgi:hypothetical protein
MNQTSMAFAHILCSARKVDYAARLRRTGLQWEYIWVCRFTLSTMALNDSASRNIFLKNFENFKGLF